MRFWACLKRLGKRWGLFELVARKNSTLYSLISIIFMLSACDPIDVCSACIKSNPASPVAPADYGKIRFNHGNILLPESAHQVFYFEECGIDCRFFSKFRMPYKEAVKFADSIRESEKISNFGGFEQRPNNKITWWPQKLPGNAIGSSGDINIEGDPYIDIAVVQEEQFATVFVYSWTM